ncbi:MAG: hypothetical protein WCC26_06690 [Terracidiphilus sp.]
MGALVGTAYGKLAALRKLGAKRPPAGGLFFAVALVYQEPTEECPRDAYIALIEIESRKLHRIKASFFVA